MKKKEEVKDKTMSFVDWDNYLKSYYEKPSSGRTWSGFEVKETYTSKDLKHQDLENRLGAPGEYPFTRGIHKTMFRGRYWTRREVIGMGSPDDTNARVKYLTDHGGTGLNTIADITYEMGLDADHPWAVNEVGLQGLMSPTSEIWKP